MPEDIKIISITPELFAPFGDILDRQSAPDVMINQGRCGRHHDQADKHIYYQIIVHSFAVLF